MSRELGTLLTGRHLTFYIYPLSFEEQLNFKHIELPHNITLNTAPAIIEYELLNYIRWGGFPAVVMAPSDEQREHILTQYFEDILYRDVALRHSIRDLAQLRQIAVHLLTHSASLLSATRIGTIFGISTELAINICGYLEESFLITLLPHFSLKSAERVRNPQKIHALDPGLRTITAISASNDLGHAIESLVYLKLVANPSFEIYYWRKEVEIDFLVRQKNQTRYLIQVAAAGIDEARVQQREIRALTVAKSAFPDAVCMLICHELPADKESFTAEGIQVIPLWQFLLKELA